MGAPNPRAGGSGLARPGETAVAVGKFDGVHLGHQALLRRVRAAADERGLEAAVLTFENNPLSLLHPERCPPSIMSPRQRAEAILACGVTNCVMTEFGAALAAMTPEEFAREMLAGQLRARHVVVGPDFRFGRGGRGDGAELRALGAELGFSVEVVAAVVDAELGRVSSSRIREALRDGEVAVAERLLGRPAAVRAEVVHGDARGRGLGFPTANLGGEVEGLAPAEGVYAGWAVLGDARVGAAISVGTNPTFTPTAEMRVEAHLLDFDRSIYGEGIEVRFAERVRGMDTFASVEELVAQMHRDVAAVRTVLGG